MCDSDAGARGQFRVRLGSGGFDRLNDENLVRLGVMGRVLLSDQSFFRLDDRGLVRLDGEGVSAIGGFSDGGGVRVNCLLGVKIVAGILLSLLTDFFPFLFLIGAVGA